MEKCDAIYGRKIFATPITPQKQEITLHNIDLSEREATLVKHRYLGNCTNSLISKYCGQNTKGRKEGNVLFNDALNTFYLRLYGVGHMVEDHSVREETRCRHMGYSFRLTARVLLYAPSHRQDSTYHGL